MKYIFTYLKHFTLVSLAILLLGFAVLVSNKGTVSFGTDDLAIKVGGEGPHVFYKKNQVESLVIRGGREQGFWVDTSITDSSEKIEANIYFALEDLHIPISIQTKHDNPATEYNDNAPIIAISDLEGNFKAFRDFLQAHKVIDEQLKWQFEQGHLVLVGDLVDRGNSTTQLLWFVHDLEQQAQAAGGMVHYIIGNHEIKNMYGDFSSAASKYIPISGILGVTQSDLFSDNSVIGRWMSSKNVIEKINGYIFTHGGLHPDISKLNIALADINNTVRNHYRQFYYPRRDADQQETLLVSNKTGPAWYRGYFEGEVNDAQLQATLDSYNAKGIVVGHTLQFNVNTQFDGKLFAIDVKHPNDYSASFPSKSSQGLYLHQGKVLRLLDDGKRTAL
ncbi:metallophosphoesterase [Pseudoalteromonas sp. T1lg65]|uniref:metallophosphoesterase n=1 Tax=Pseudoalteromonas sp. T1lg65 TaxID=2077101 RepID=UPI003F7A183C